MMTPLEICRELGYTKAWIELGVIDEAYLLEQWSIFTSSDDKNKEHYRCGAIHDYLNRHRTFSDEEVVRFLELSDAGSDGCDLTTHRAIELIDRAELENSQFSLLANHSCFQTDPAKKRYERIKVLRAVRESGIKDKIEEIKKSDDGPLHALLLNSEDSPIEAIDWLSEFGRNKAIRNQAKIKLKKIKKTYLGASHKDGKPPPES